jgi:hypothetical protein
MVDAQSTVRRNRAEASKKAQNALDCYEGKSVEAGNQSRAPHLPWEQPAEASEPKTAQVEVPGVGKKPCVQDDFFTADKLLRKLPQTAKLVRGTFDSESYNCFYYVETEVEKQLPYVIPYRHGALSTSPSMAYIDDGYLLGKNYNLVGTTASLSENVYRTGDIILVPGRDATLSPDQQFKHAALVLGTRDGVITRIRQKIDAFKCVVDLTPEEFRKVYPPETVPKIVPRYQVFRQPTATDGKDAARGPPARR